MPVLSSGAALNAAGVAAGGTGLAARVQEPWRPFPGPDERTLNHSRRFVRGLHSSANRSSPSERQFVSWWIGMARRPILRPPCKKSSPSDPGSTFAASRPSRRQTVPCSRPIQAKRRIARIVFPIYQVLGSGQSYRIPPASIGGAVRIPRGCIPMVGSLISEVPGVSGADQPFRANVYCVHLSNVFGPKTGSPSFWLKTAKKNRWRRPCSSVRTKLTFC